jgi:Icc protein
MVEDYVIAHLSDLHVGEEGFRSESVKKCIEEVNQLHPDITVMTGDLTHNGLNEEFEKARELIDMFEEEPIVIMGNHDARNVGYNTFEQYFGKRMVRYEDDKIFLLGIDSTQPDIDEGHIGRIFQENIHTILSQVPQDKTRFFALHHHLVPVPNAGRERDIVTDAGDVLKMLISDKVKVILCGHRHVPWVWNLEELIIAHAGTLGSPRLVGMPNNSYLITRIREDTLQVCLKILSKSEKTIKTVNLSSK